MKRRNRKRNTKAARLAKIPVDAEKAAGPSVTLAVADDGTHLRHEFVAPVEVEKPAESAIALAGSDYVTDLSDEFIAAIEAEEPTSNSTAKSRNSPTSSKPTAFRKATASPFTWA